MKRVVLLSVLAILVVSAQLGASRIEITMSGGLGTASFSSLNDQIDSINIFINEINQDVEPITTVTTTVAALPSIDSGISFQVGEQWCILDWLAIGTMLEYFSAASSTSGEYVEDGEDYEVALAYDVRNVGLLATATIDLINTPSIALSVGANGGYFSCQMSQDSTFNIPPAIDATYSDSLPTEGISQYSGGTFGYEAGTSLSFAITDWFAVNSSAFYRSAVFSDMTDVQGGLLDTDGDEEPDPLYIQGFVFQLGFSLGVDLSL